MNRCFARGSLLLLAILTLAYLAWLARFPAAALIWDDAYIFWRYADHLRAGHGLAWNPGGPAAFGLTSNLYLLLVLPGRMLWPTNPALGLSAASFLAGTIFVILLTILIPARAAGSFALRLGSGALALFALWSSREVVGDHFTSGMDTTFAMAYLALFIFAAKGFEASPTRRAAWAAGLLGGLAFLVRPDLLLYTLAVPAALGWLAAEMETRRRARLMLGLTAGLTLLEIAGCAWYYGSPLPLSFYNKVLARYGPLVQSLGQNAAREMLRAYLRGYWYYFALIGAWAVLRLRGRPRHWPPMEAALLGATAIFLASYALLVQQIMPYSARFYFPTLPAIIFLGSQGIAEIAQRLPARKIPPLAPLWQGLGMAALGVGVAVALLALVGQVRAAAGRDWAEAFDLDAVYAKDYSHTWFALREISRLPDSLTLATTEVGYPGAANPGKTIVDLSGLNETAFAHQGFSADRLLLNYRPDFIYLPHRYYQDMKIQLLSHPVFQRDYEFYPVASLGDFRLNVALRRQSRFYSELRRIVENNLPKNAAPENP